MVSSTDDIETTGFHKQKSKGRHLPHTICRKLPQKGPKLNIRAINKQAKT